MSKSKRPVVEQVIFNASVVSKSHVGAWGIEVQKTELALL